MKFLLSLLFSICCFADYSMIFVHIGDSLPSHAFHSLAQARLFNKECPIYLIVNQGAVNPASLADHNITVVTCESLNKTRNHLGFIQRNNLGGGFWSHTTERLFYVDDLITQYSLQNAFHLENDVMVYTNLETILPLFEKNYPNMIGATFDCDTRCIPGFLYFANSKPSNKLTQFIAQNVRPGANDMVFLSEFKDKHHKTYIDHLPIVNTSYTNYYPLMTPEKVTTSHPNFYTNHFSEFNSIFDAAAIGQYLGGIDPIHGALKIGFINESCLFNPSYFTYEWEADEEGRLVPFALFKSQRIRINNLHIHSKNTQGFYSIK